MLKTLTLLLAFPAVAHGSMPKVTVLGPSDNAGRATHLIEAEWHVINAVCKALPNASGKDVLGCYDRRNRVIYSSYDSIGNIDHEKCHARGESDEVCHGPKYKSFRWDTFNRKYARRK